MVHPIDQLFATNPFLHDDANKGLFISSFRACAKIHYEKSDLFRGLWQESHLKPEDIQTEQDLAKVPFLMVNLFKEHELITGDPHAIVLNLTSSGTTGQKSQIFLNQESLDRVKSLAWQIHSYLGMTSNEEVNYLCFTYDPTVATHLGTAFTDELLTSFTGKKNVYYAIQWNQSMQNFELNVQGVLDCLNRYLEFPNPVRILGFPAHLYKIVREHNLNVKLPANSWIQTGGGWKGFANEEVSKEVFRSFISQHLGLPEENIRDMFGMVEHGIPYCDCKKGKFHIPNYARVFIRSPRDLSLMSGGETGLIHFLCSYVTSYPSISLLTTDYGRIGSCDCGLGGETLEIVGRAGISKHKGCALTASKLLDASSN